MDSKGVLFQIVGGLGANVMQTAVLREFKKQNPDKELHVRAAYPDVFKMLPFIDSYQGNVPVGSAKTYADFELMGLDEPYADLEYRRHNCHYIEAACRRYGLKPVDDLEISGVIKLTKREEKIGLKYYHNLFEQAPQMRGKKLIAFQWTGGTPTFNPNMANQPERATIARSLPQEIAQSIVNKLVENGYAVLQVSVPAEPKLNGCLHLSLTQQPMPIRYMFSILNLCNGLIGIDSSAQHIWKALGKDKAIVLWGGNSPKQLGYDSNINLINEDTMCDCLHCNRPSIMGDVLGNGEVWACPIDEDCMYFNADKVVAAFENSQKQQEDKPVVPNEG